MKASESVKNYPSSLRMYTNYTVREIKKMCQSIGPRPSGTESERKAQEHLVSEMKTCCDKAATEDFKMSKYAEKLDELGLSEIGISNPHLVPSFGSVADELGIKYSAAHTGRFFKDTSINYNLEVDVDYRKEKGIQLTKRKAN